MKQSKTKKKQCKSHLKLKNWKHVVLIKIPRRLCCVLLIFKYDQEGKKIYFYLLVTCHKLISQSHYGYELFVVNNFFLLEKQTLEIIYFLLLLVFVCFFVSVYLYENDIYRL